MTGAWSRPSKLRDVDVAFPASVRHLMPAYDEIPDDFKRSRNPWVDAASHWFFRGGRPQFKVRDGVDVRDALRHLKAILGSFEPQHEHKEAAVAYLMSLWFEKFTFDEGEAQP